MASEGPAAGADGNHAPAEAASASQPSADAAPTPLLQAVVSAREERQALLDALAAERAARAAAEGERDTALARVEELEALLSENDEELERTLASMQAITAGETARAARAAAELRAERAERAAAVAAACLHESDAELERRLASPATSAAASPASAAAAAGSPAGPSWTDENAEDEASPKSGAEDAISALTSKLLEQRRARAAASAKRITQIAYHRDNHFGALASAAAAAAADASLTLSAAAAAAAAAPAPSPPPVARPMGPGRSMAGRRSASCGSLGGSTTPLALPDAPYDWSSAATPPPTGILHPGWVSFATPARVAPQPRNPFADESPSPPPAGWVQF